MNSANETAEESTVHPSTDPMRQSEREFKRSHMALRRLRSRVRNGFLALELSEELSSLLPERHSKVRRTLANAIERIVVLEQQEEAVRRKEYALEQVIQSRVESEVTSGRHGYIQPEEAVTTGADTPLADYFTDAVVPPAPPTTLEVTQLQVPLETDSTDSLSASGLTRSHMATDTDDLGTVEAERPDTDQHSVDPSLDTLSVTETVKGTRRERRAASLSVEETESVQAAMRTLDSVKEGGVVSSDLVSKLFSQLLRDLDNLVGESAEVEVELLRCEDLSNSLLVLAGSVERNSDVVRRVQEDYWSRLGGLAQSIASVELGLLEFRALFERLTASPKFPRLLRNFPELDQGYTSFLNCQGRLVTLSGRLVSLRAVHQRALRGSTPGAALSVVSPVHKDRAIEELARLRSEVERLTKQVQTTEEDLRLAEEDIEALEKELFEAEQATDRTPNALLFFTALQVDGASRVGSVSASASVSSVATFPVASNTLQLRSRKRNLQPINTLQNGSPSRHVTPSSSATVQLE
eukprot:gene1041-1174_t